MRVSSSSQSDPGVGGIEDGVETLTTYTKRSMSGSCYSKEETGWKLMTYRNVNPLIKSKP